MWLTRKRRMVAFALLLTVLLAVAAACGGLRESSRQNAPAGVPEDLAKVWETYQTLQQRYVDKEALDPQKLSAGAIRGMLQALGDPFTSYFDAPAFRAQGDDLVGSFEGIGATVAMRDGQPTVVEPLPNSPAEKAGLQSGDIIREINGQPVDGLTLEQVVEKVRGPSGTSVRLVVQPLGSGALKDLTMVRATIQLSTIISRLIGDDIAVVRVSHFARRTASDLDQALDDLREKKVKGIVLDLRNNPGGVLTVVVHVASQFLRDGLVLYEVDASGKRTDWGVEKGGRFTDAPMAVLVDGGSASGSEVVAGAIQASGRGKVIGTRTFGKGVVSVPVPLKDGSGLYVTTATWFMPSGKQIGKVGVSPDIEVRRTLEDLEAGRDPQLDRAVEVLRQALKARG